MDPIKEELLSYIRKLVYEETGIVLTPDKDYLIEARLRPVARGFGYKGIAQLLESLHNSRFGEKHKETAEAFITAETLFFRDTHPFETLRDSIVPELMVKREKERKLSIWSAACSTHIN